MNTYSFRKDLLAVQEELLRFAYKLTADREEANDLLQETSLKALDNEDKFEPDTSTLRQPLNSSKWFFRNSCTSDSL